MTDRALTSYFGILPDEVAGSETSRTSDQVPENEVHPQPVATLIV